MSKKTELHAAFAKWFNRTPIPMLDIPRVMDKSRDLMILGHHDADRAMQLVRETYKEVKPGVFQCQP